MRVVVRFNKPLVPVDSGLSPEGSTSVIPSQFVAEQTGKRTVVLCSVSGFRHEPKKKIFWLRWDSAQIKTFFDPELIEFCRVVRRRRPD